MNFFFTNLISLKRSIKKSIVIFFDAMIVVLILLCSFSLRFNEVYFPSNEKVWSLLIFSSPIIAVITFYKFGLYNSMVRYIGLKSLWTIAQATSFYAAFWGGISLMVTAGNYIPGIPRSVIFINWVLIVLSISSIRFLMRWLLIDNQNISNTRVLIYGAGSAGRELSLALLQSNQYRQIAFIDDNNDIQGRLINGFEILHIDQLTNYVNKFHIDEILLAIPSISNQRRNEIIKLLEGFPLTVRSLPGVTELAQGKVKIEDLRDISIKDLLGRDAVMPDIELLKLNTSNKVVMITGAGGSIGSEICRQVLKLNPTLIILFDNSEFALYKIEKELLDINDEDIKIIALLGSVVNKARLEKIISKFRVQTIYHAAAYKHVPMVEFNNSEGVVNNIFGTLYCAEAAINNMVETFVLISTDKAVRSTNTMGATKRFSELLLQAKSKIQSHTRFTIVRFGNVLGSSGSVIPLFKKQIQQGGPITITDPDMIRYFMTIPEAVELVIQAGAMGKKGGEVFILDMGDPVSILDLAKKMIFLSGLQLKDKTNSTGDIEIKYTGLRPGEKLYEELLIGDNSSSTSHPMILSAEEKMISWEDLNKILVLLKDAIDKDDHEQIRANLIDAVEDFKPQCEISDLLYH
ncbi:polysaccharide biosynthesis protein [bacterium]|nr:polysaccharide biosynthesis protein [bacterium]